MITFYKGHKIEANKTENGIQYSTIRTKDKMVLSAGTEKKKTLPELVFSLKEKIENSAQIVGSLQSMGYAEL